MRIRTILSLSLVFLVATISNAQSLIGWENNTRKWWTSSISFGVHDIRYGEVASPVILNYKNTNLGMLGCAFYKDRSGDDQMYFGPTYSHSLYSTSTWDLGFNVGYTGALRKWEFRKGSWGLGLYLKF